MRIKKGDQVKIMKGKDRGKVGRVLSVFSEENRISVEGMNLVRKRVRAKRQGQKGEVVMVARPLSAANVMLVCKSCGKPTRTGSRAEGATKVRICKRCGAIT